MKGTELQPGDVLLSHVHTTNPYWDQHPYQFMGAIFLRIKYYYHRNWLDETNNPVVCKIEYVFQRHKYTEETIDFPIYKHTGEFEDPWQFEVTRTVRELRKRKICKVMG